MDNAIETTIWDKAIETTIWDNAIETTGEGKGHISHFK